MLLRLKVLRFSFAATRPFTFPASAGNKLRGSIGNALWQRSDGAYARFFDPTSARGPSGLSDPPRPFVLRAAHLDGTHIGDTFHFDLHLFDLNSDWEAVLAESLQDLGFARLRDVAQEALAFDLVHEPITALTIQFLTPMELKTGGELALEPEFGILAARARDRISTLRQLYGDGPLEIDFAGFGERAAQIAMTRCDIRKVEIGRRSASTGQTHSLGGFVGEADYTGDLAEFIPYLRVAEWVGIGRQTTWGKGVIALRK